MNLNGTDYNTTNTFWNASVDPSGWANITVYAYNNSGTGTPSTGEINDSVQAPAAPTYLPLDPTGLANVAGKYWVNYTWDAGSGNITDSYNVNLNGTDYNTTNTFWNASVDPSGWANITVYAYNNSGTGTPSTGEINDSVQAPAAPTYLPLDPTGLANVAGKYWVNYTWDAGSGNITDSYNVNLNGTDYNTTNTFWNASVDPSGWANITVYAYNISGTGTLSTGNITDSVQAPALPKFYYTGNRIWDASEEMSTTYTWTSQSFSGFFYDIHEDVGSENLTIYLDSRNDRSIEEGDLVYESKPVNINFKHEEWGKYDIVGFMAKENYFAGYNNTNVYDADDSILSKGYISEVLIDEDNTHTVNIGSPYTLGGGYALKPIDISKEDNQVRFILLKDGEEVSDSDTIVKGGEDYVYKTKVGSVKNVPIIMVHIFTVFHGRETDMAQIEGVFQISDMPEYIKTGSSYGEKMEVTKRSSSGIEMKNHESISLDAGNTIDVMGKIKFEVADDSNTLRFAPFVDGLEKLYGTVSRGDASFEWTPLNFEGLYYDFETGFWSETLNATVDVNGCSIAEDNLVYESKPVNINFKHEEWGKYDLVGFMAKNYFAGYNNTNVDDADANILSKGYISEVLIDEDKKHTVNIGSPYTLGDGYALKPIDISKEDNQVRFILLKDGEEVSDSDTIVKGGEDYVYKTKVGSVKNVPIIMVHIFTVFHGRETDMAQIEGVFQISDMPEYIKTGSSYGEKMEVTKRSSSGIEMKNHESISLDAGNTIDVMGKIKFEVADDSNTLRFRPFITVDVEAEAASKLDITAPDTASERDTITIGITAGGELIAGSDVEFNGENIGITDTNGEVLYELTSAGNFIINATKLGYESASKTITVEEYSETQLRIESVSELLQTDTFELTVTAGETPLSGVDVFVDDSKVGVTGTDGIFSYMFDTSGTRTVKVEKEGYDAAEKTVNVIKPSAEFKAVAFNITPVHVTHKQPVFVIADIKNTGNIKGEHVVELRINGSVVASQNTTLNPGEVTTLNFTYTESEPGSYFAEIENMGGEFQVVKKSIGWLVYASIITAIGLIVIYLVTMRREAIAPIIAPIGSKVVAAKGRLASKLSQLKTKVKK
ncbi:MAG: hypothetical protein AEth_01768 [Candidatus Argoarchaeum ethanivorans]|uniref:S-layer family duplication domain-containing protein n=1 Tax=Candidatus Argoarchaeum ethanivorans TaxID=2608793 RepID=A0A8B3RYN3_9EURY|nr:MAG: hypothetical protein AEth_01768 [Candidatus Argoarchaeum ethanivorans]